MTVTPPLKVLLPLSSSAPRWSWSGAGAADGAGHGEVEAGATVRVLVAPLIVTGPAQVMSPPAPAWWPPAGDDRVGVDEVDRVVQRDGVDRQSGTLVATAWKMPPVRLIGPVPSGPLAMALLLTLSLAVDHEVAAAEVGAARVSVVRVLHHQGCRRPC